MLEYGNEVRMEVVSEEEAIAYCLSNDLVYDHIYMGKGTNAGKVMMLAYSKNKKPSNMQNMELENTEMPKNEEKKYVIYTMVGSSRLYWSASSKRRCSFNISDADRFSFNVARGKMIGMNKIGTREWKIGKVTK